MEDECGDYRRKGGKTFEQMKQDYAREGVDAVMGANEKPLAAFGTKQGIQEMKRTADITAALNFIQKDIFDTAEASGWHERVREMPEIIALIHSEASEALEAFREGMEPDDCQYRYKVDAIDPDPSFEDGEYCYTTLPVMEDVEGNTIYGKPEGIASEMADIIIRVLDASEELGIPTIRVMLEKMRFNKTRSYKHGGKRV